MHISVGDTERQFFSSSVCPCLLHRKASPTPRVFRLRCCARFLLRALIERVTGECHPRRQHSAPPAPAPFVANCGAKFTSCAHSPECIKTTGLSSAATVWLGGEGRLNSVPGLEKSIVGSQLLDTLITLHKLVGLAHARGQSLGSGNTADGGMFSTVCGPSAMELSPSGATVGSVSVGDPTACPIAVSCGERDVGASMSNDIAASVSASDRDIPSIRADSGEDDGVECAQHHRPPSFTSKAALEKARGVRNDTRNQGSHSQEGPVGGRDSTTFAGLPDVVPASADMGVRVNTVTATSDGRCDAEDEGSAAAESKTRNASGSTSSLLPLSSSPSSSTSRSKSSDSPGFTSVPWHDREEESEGLHPWEALRSMDKSQQHSSNPCLTPKDEGGLTKHERDKQTWIHSRNHRVGHDKDTRSPPPSREVCDLPKEHGADEHSQEDPEKTRRALLRCAEGSLNVSAAILATGAQEGRRLGENAEKRHQGLMDKEAGFLR